MNTKIVVVIALMFSFQNVLAAGNGGGKDKPPSETELRLQALESKVANLETTVANNPPSIVMVDDYNTVIGLYAGAIGTSSVRVISDYGYLFILNAETVIGRKGIYYESSDCSESGGMRIRKYGGVLINYDISIIPDESVQGEVFRKHIGLGIGSTELYYVPHDNITINPSILYRVLVSSDKSCVAESVNREWYQVLPNDSTITGVDNTVFTPPFRQFIQ